MEGRVEEDWRASTVSSASQNWGGLNIGKYNIQSQILGRTSRKHELSITGIRSTKDVDSTKAYIE